MTRILLLFFLWLPFSNAVEIAFFMKTLPNGEIETYEAGTLYSHVAIKVGKQWLEAHPYYGVHLSHKPIGVGEIAEILIDHSIPEPSPKFLERVLGKSYFLFADWEDPDVFNCTKLVALYLGVEPNAMDFDPQIWGGRFEEYVGLPGLSVAELYSELKARGYQSVLSQSCLGNLLL